MQALPDDPPHVTDGRTTGRLIELAPAEVAGLIAPRALQVQSGINDKLIPIEQDRQTAERAALYNGKLGASDKFVFNEFEGGHEFRSSLIWLFLKNGSSPCSC